MILYFLLGSRPLGEDGDSDRVKLRVLDLLHEKYGICEDDFTSAELEVVPAFNATDLGLDRSLIGAYGHDDRVCSYAALKGLFDIDVPEKTAVCLLDTKLPFGSASAQLTALPENLAARCGLQPFHAVGTDGGLLLYFRPDCVL